MFFDILFIVLGAIIQTIVYILSFVGWLMPPEWHTLINTAFSYIVVVQGYIPLYPDPSIESGLAKTIGIMTIVNWSIVFFIASYIFRMVMTWLPMPHMFRFGLNPEVNSQLDLRPADRGSGKVVDLRRGKRSSRKYLSDIH